VSHSPARVVLAVVVLVTALGGLDEAAEAKGGAVNAPRAADSSPLAGRARAEAGTPARPAQPRPARGAERSPSGQPLVTGVGGTPPDGDGEEAADAGVEGEADPLVANGLGSPLCRDSLGSGLPRSGRRNCETSGFVAAPAPTSDYGIDVHIDGGVLGVSPLGTVQDLFVTPLWMALVWAVHALMVMFEWCFEIDVLNTAAAGGLGGGLRQMQATLTDPWLAGVLAIAAVLAAYNGLVRRRVAETVGEALLMGAMMVGGMWVILDPTGTVGALGGWANQASLGTLAVTTSGTPAGAGGALASSLGGVFSVAIEAPWCYLEFGDVGWCREPRMLDPQLRAAALKIAAAEQALESCGAAGSSAPCPTPGSAQASALKRSAELLRDARNNGAIFLALPANGSARNSINETGSLLRTLCQTSDATACRGPTSAQAEFRTSSGTWSRVGGLLLILAGALGMLLLLGFIVLRLLTSALLALLYLMIAPAAVLAPALGDAGRAAFRTWATRLLGAVVSKLVYAFLLGVVLAIVAMLSELRAVGWWTQWLLMSAFWWGAYMRRHEALGLAGGSIAPRHPGAYRSVAQRVARALPSGAAGRAAQWTKGKRSKPPPRVAEDRRRQDHLGRQRAREVGEEQVGRSLRSEQAEAQARVAAGAQTQARLAAMRKRLQRLRMQRERASAAGDDRRAASLDARSHRLQGEAASEEEALRAARRTVADGDPAKRRTGQGHGREQREQRARWLDDQAALPAGGRLGSDGERRDYGALAGLVALGRGQYERLDPRRRREARLQIDRELALRRDLGGAAAGGVAEGPSTSFGSRPGPLEKDRTGRDFDRAPAERLGAAGDRLPGSRPRDSSVERSERDHPPARGNQRRDGSPVMDDAREVAARRKRQLGWGRR
jgi:hypothetical protein